MLWTSGANTGTLLRFAQSFSSAQAGACSICSTTLPVVGLPNVVLPEGTAGVLTKDRTCADTEELAQSGYFTSAQCDLLQESIAPRDCGCASTEHYEDTPPVLNTGLNETPGVDLPGTFITISREEASLTESNVTGSVSIRLAPAPEWNEYSRDMFLESCAIFYRIQLNATNVTCAARIYQFDYIEWKITLATDVTSKFATRIEVENYNQTLIDVIEQNSTDLLFFLQRQGTALNMLYFSQVETIDAFSPTTVPSLAASPPVESPASKPKSASILTSEPSGGQMSLGVVLGAVAVGMVFLAVIGYFIMHRRQLRKAQSPQTRSGQPNATSMMSSSTPLVSAIPIDDSVIENPPSSPANVTHNDQVRDAIPMATAASIQPHSPLTYKDQARDHPDAAIPTATAASVQPHSPLTYKDQARDHPDAAIPEALAVAAEDTGISPSNKPT